MDFQGRTTDYAMNWLFARCQSTSLKLLARSAKEQRRDYWDGGWRQRNPVLTHCNTGFRGSVDQSCSKLKLDVRKLYKPGVVACACNIRT